MTTKQTMLPVGTVVAVGPGYRSAESLAPGASHFANDEHSGIYTVVGMLDRDYKLVRGVVPAEALDPEDYDVFISASRVSLAKEAA